MPLIQVTRSIAIDEREVEESFTRSSGPGGQHVNTTDSAVLLRFDVWGSPNLPDLVKARMSVLAGSRLSKDGVLTLRGEKKSEVEDRDRGYSERSYGRFERRIGLPRTVEADKASASFRNGVLTITLPKSAAATDNVRRIPIHSDAA